MTTIIFLRKLLGAFLCLGVLLITGCCPDCNCSSPANALSVIECIPGNVSIPVTLTMLHMNDFDAQLVPHLDVVQLAGTPHIEERGGIARLATLIKRIRTENTNPILLNVGDTFHGGVEAKFTRGNAIVNPVNALGVDIGVPGSDEFSYDPPLFFSRFSYSQNALVLRTNAPYLAANVTNIMGSAMLPPSKLMYIGGVYVGFIGIMSDSTPAKYNTIGMNFLEGEQNYKLLVEHHAQLLRNRGALVVVLLSDLGLPKNKRLADILAPNLVDVVFSGGTHELTTTALHSSSGALVVEAGNDGYLGQMDIHLNQQKIVNLNWKVHTLDASLTEDPDMKEIVDQARAQFFSPDVNMSATSYLHEEPARLTRAIDTVVGKTTVPLLHHNALAQTLTNHFAKSLKAVSGSDIAIFPSFQSELIIPEEGYLLDDEKIASGEITISDINRMIPSHFTISVTELTGAELKRLLELKLSQEFSQDTFLQIDRWMPGMAGMDLVVNLNNPDGSKITSLHLSGSGLEVSDSAVLFIAGCIDLNPRLEGVCGMLEGMETPPLMINPNTQLPYTGVELAIDSLLNNPIVTASQQVHDLSGIHSWPIGNYKQPIGLQ